ncbi:MAG: protein kinase [Chloroflexota bacterium]
MSVDNLVVNLVDQYKVEQLEAVKRYTDHYSAYDVDEDRSVTLDILRLDGVSTGFAAQFTSRARAIAQIRHPNIVRIFTVGRTQSERPYVAQVDIDGYPLSQRLEQLASRRTPVNPIYALKMVRQLTDALLLATRLDLLHYDLRPQNVFLKNVALPTDDVLVLTDLFVPYERRNWDTEATDKELLDYLSPEQRAGKEINAGSHVYTLGVLAFHLLTSTLPPQPTANHEVLLRRITTVGTPLERLRGGLSAETYELVDRSLRKDSHQRYDSIEEFSTALEQALLAEELLVGSPGLTAATPARRSWGVMAILILVVLGIVASVIGAQLLNLARMLPLTAFAAMMSGDGRRRPNQPLRTGPMKPAWVVGMLESVVEA